MQRIQKRRKNLKVIAKKVNSEKKWRRCFWPIGTHKTMKSQREQSGCAERGGITGCLTICVRSFIYSLSDVVSYCAGCALDGSRYHHRQLPAQEHGELPMKVRGTANESDDSAWRQLLVAVITSIWLVRCLNKQTELGSWRSGSQWHCANVLLQVSPMRRAK